MSHKHVREWSILFKKRNTHKKFDWNNFLWSTKLLKRWKGQDQQTHWYDMVGYKLVLRLLKIISW